jgi:hypothetical protein
MCLTGPRGGPILGVIERGATDWTRSLSTFPLSLVPRQKVVIGLKLSGALVDITRSAGDFINDSGNKVVYDFTLLKVFTGLDVVAVRLPTGTRVEDLPFGKGDSVNLEVTVPPTSKIMYAGVSAPVVAAGAGGSKQ